MESRLTAERLRQLLAYDPETGTFRWNVRRQGARQDVEPGYIERLHGYRRIKIDGVLEFAHRLAWLWMTAEWPSMQVDHINCVRSDNKWSNLRLASASQNRYNMRKHGRNTSGFKGVSARRGGWRAAIRYDGHNIHLGDFQTPEEAHSAYVKASEALFGHFARAA